MENTGSQVEVGATVRDTGGAGGGGSGTNGTNNTNNTNNTNGAGGGTLTDSGCASELCRIIYSAARIPEVTMDDLVAFRPGAPSIASEPAGIGLAGLPTNLVAAAESHTVTGELFGYAVTVRFTPTAYVFDHGDGTAQRTATGGAGWAVLGQADFTPTATSYAYPVRGAYTASVSVEYTAQIDFGGGWRAVPGILTLRSAGYEVRIVEAHTALVGRTCLENPAGPGC